MHAQQQAMDWAAKRKLAMERAAELRDQRKLGVVDDNHTFQPEKISRARPDQLGHPNVVGRDGLDNYFGKHPGVPLYSEQPFGSDPVPPPAPGAGHRQMMAADQLTVPGPPLSGHAGNAAHEGMARVSMDSLSSEVVRHGGPALPDGPVGSGSAARPDGCTGSSGCSCAKCYADSQFQSMLRGGSRPAAAGALNDRPAWQGSDENEAPHRHGPAYYDAMRSELSQPDSGPSRYALEPQHQPPVAAYQPPGASSGSRSTEYASSSAIAGERNSPAAPDPSSQAGGLSLLKTKMRSRTRGPRNGSRRSRATAAAAAAPGDSGYGSTQNGPAGPLMADNTSSNGQASGRGAPDHRQPGAFGAPAEVRARRRPSRRAGREQGAESGGGYSTPSYGSAAPVSFSSADHNQAAHDRPQYDRQQQRGHVEWLDGAPPGAPSSSIGAAGRSGAGRADVTPDFGQQQQQQQRQQQQQQQQQQRQQPPPPPVASASDAGDIAQGPRVECPDCGRKFNEMAFAKHSRVCRKVFVQKRKPVNLTAARVGDAAAQQGSRVPPSSRAGGTKRRGAAARGPSAKGTSWQAKSAQLRQAMRAMRPGGDSGGGSFDGGGGGEAFVDPSMKQCPHCLRTFNLSAADRHIPQCSSIKAKPKRLMRGSGTQLGMASRQRMSSRTRGPGH